MSRIDSHQHFWHYAPSTHPWITPEMQSLRRDFLPTDLLPHLSQHRIDGCVAVHASQSEDETAFLLDLAHHHDFIRGVVGWIDLQSDQLPERLAQYRSFSKLVGFRHIVQDETDPEFLARPAFRRGVALLADHHLTYDLLINANQLSAATALVQALPQVQFVLDHLGKPNISRAEQNPWQDHIMTLATHPNVYCKLSGMVTEADWEHWQPADMTFYLDTILEAFGTERIMYGSDWPVCLLAASYDRVYSLVSEYVSRLSATAQADVFGNNAAKFYNLPNE